MKKNKILSLLLLYVVACMIFVGCGDEVPEDEGGKTVENARYYYQIIKDVIGQCNSEAEPTFMAIETPELYTSSGDAKKSFDEKKGSSGIYVTVDFNDGSHYHVMNDSNYGITSDSYGTKSYFDKIFAGQNSSWVLSHVMGIWLCVNTNKGGNKIYAIPVDIEDYLSQMK